MASDSPVSLMTRAVGFLARREYSRLELAKKLSRYLTEDQCPDEIDEVLDRLQARGYLSDERYARTRARVRGLRYGNRRIAMELRDQGVDSETVEATLESMEESELTRAQRLWERRFGEPAQDYKERGKQIRFLANRGFSMDTVMKVVKGEFEFDE